MPAMTKKEMAFYKRRKKDIERLRRNGVKLVSIGERYGISKQRVSQILNRRK